jgi:hypothetical protein
MNNLKNDLIRLLDSLNKIEKIEDPSIKADTSLINYKESVRKSSSCLIENSINSLNKSNITLFFEEDHVSYANDFIKNMNSLYNEK